MKCVLGVAGILALSAVITGGLFARGAARGTFDRTLNVGEPAQVQVQTGSGSIRIHNGTGGTVIVHAEIRGGTFVSESTIRQIEKNPPIEQNGNTIRIGRQGVAGLFRNISISYDITVPANSQVEAHTGSGSVRLGGVKGPVVAHTGSGSLEISDCGVDVRAGTGSGGIRLQNVSGRVNAHTGSGSIKANGDPTADWKLHTGSGSVQVDFPSSAAFEVRAHTGSGGISVEQPVTMHGQFGKNRVEGKVRGGGPLVEITTGSGSIHIGTGRGQAL